MLSGENRQAFFCGETKMTTDPKKNDEVKDEELERVAGGAGDDTVDEQPDPGGGGKDSEIGKAGMRRA